MRTVIPDHQVAFDLDAAKATYRRTDDAYQGLEWRLSRRPDHVVHIGNGYYLYKRLGYPTLRIPTITVLYRFDDNEVLISAIWIFLIFKLSHY